MTQGYLDDTQARMVRELKKRGNSLSPGISHLLHIDSETPLDIGTDGTRLIVTPTGESNRREKFEAAQEWVYLRYGKTVQKLAEWSQANR